LDAVRSSEEPAQIAGFGPGFRIYRHNYRAQLLSVLRETFNRVRLWLGDDAFDAAAQTQILKSPPSSWTLDAYGRDFPAVLKKLYPKDPEVAELAWLDLAMADAFVTADVQPLGVEALADVDWDGAHIDFVPLQRSRAATNAAHIWMALDGGVMPPAATSLERSGGYLVWRSGYVPRFRLAEAREFRAVDALNLGKSFDEVCAQIEAEAGMEQAIGIIAAMLRQWLADGMVARIARPQS
jgi:hypothetical protein